MRWILFFVAVVVLFFVQGVLARVTPLAPDLGPVLAVFVGLFARREALVQAAVLVALLRGALDLQPMGLQLLVYLGIALCVDVARDVVFRDRLATQLVLSFVAGVGFVFLQWTVASFLPSVSAAAGGDLLGLAASSLSGTLLAPGVFGLLRFLRAVP